MAPISTPSRNRIIAIHDNLGAPLIQALAERGIETAPDPMLAHMDAPGNLAAYIWFYQGIRHPLQVRNLRRRLNARGLPLFCWNQDAPHYLNYTKPNRAWRLWAAQRFHLYDLYATHTLIDESRNFADLTVYLPNAANIQAYNLRGDTDTIFKQLRNPGHYRWDVTFFGGMNGRRYKEDQAREQFFSKLGRRLDTLGITHCFRETAGMSVNEQIKFIQSSRINLNFGALCEYGFPIASGLPERCYGIPACGGFILCDKRTHARDDFSVGDNWAEFDGIDDCIDQIRYWLEHFDQARNLAERCYRHVLANHTYAHRAAKLHHALLAWHEGQRGLIR